MRANLNALKISPIQAVFIVLFGLIVVTIISNGVFTLSNAIYLLALIPAVVLHEVSHGALALRFGDATAKNAGRLTLNPVKHIDPIGTIALPLVMSLSGVVPFGWAKPVPVDTAKMSRNQAMYTSLVGPATNIVLALLAVVFLRTFGTSAPSLLVQFFLSFGIANVVLAVFNLLPIPPLDGSAVIERFLPARYMMTYFKVRRFSILILLAIVLFLPGAVSAIFKPAITLWIQLVGGS